MEKVVAFVLACEAEGFAGATAVEKGRPMKQFVTEESFWELFPEAQIGIVVAHNMKPTEEVAPEDAAAIVGADLTDKSFWLRGLKSYEEEIDEFAALLGQ